MYYTALPLQPPTAKRRHWRGVLTYKDPETGKWRQRSKSLKSNNQRALKREFESWKSQMEADHERELEEAGRPDEPEAADMTVADLAREEYDAQEGSGSVEASSLTGYRSGAANVDRFMGPVKMRDLAPRDVERMQAGMREAGLAPYTVAKARGAVSAAVRRARRLGLAVDDPLKAVRPPKLQKVKRGNNALPPAERGRLSRHLDAMGDVWLRTGVLLGLHAGLRAQDACGLQWGDWDEAAGLLHLRRAIGRSKGGEYVKDLKSDERRTAPVDDGLAAALRGLREVREDEGAPHGQTDWVLSDAERWRSPAVLSRHFSTVAEVLGLTGTEGRRPCYHDLRHTYITVAVAAGVDVKTIAAIVGHKSAAMTLDVYAAVDREAVEGARELVSAKM